MSKDKLYRVIQMYREWFERSEYVKCEFPKNNLTYLSDRSKLLNHCYYMLGEMENFVDVNKLEKAFRWLGFIQGCFWSLGMCSIDDLKDDNR